MAQGAWQQAHRKPGNQTGKKAQASKEPGRNMTQKESGGIREKLQRLPVAAGMALMALMLVLSLFIGNLRALQNAAPKAFLRQGDVKSIVEDRIDAAMNVATVAERLGLGDVQTIYNAAEALDEARTAKEISRADQKLAAAVSMLTTVPLQGEDARSMLRAADDFAEMGSFLRQEARTFNEQAAKAEKLYEKLPTKFMLAEPDRYEGL